MAGPLNDGFQQELALGFLDTLGIDDNNAPVVIEYALPPPRARQAPHSIVPMPPSSPRKKGVLSERISCPKRGPVCTPIDT